MRLLALPADNLCMTERSDNHQTFDEACVDAMASLYERMNFGLWMVTRTDGADWIVLKARDRDYGVNDGDVFVWMESFCSRMVKDEGPYFAPESDKILVYAQAEIGRKVPIQAYMGFPLRKASGELIGTLCAINPTIVPESWGEHESFVAKVASDLGRAYESDYDHAASGIIEQGSAAEQADAMKVLFGLDWDTLAAYVDEEAKETGRADSVIQIQVDSGNRSEEVFKKALRKLIGPNSYLMYRGGDLYTIILVDCNGPKIEAHVNAVRACLNELKVKHSLGYAIRPANQRMSQACDKAMGMVIRQELGTRAA